MRIRGSLLAFSPRSHHFDSVNLRALAAAEFPTIAGLVMRQVIIVDR